MDKRQVIVVGGGVGGATAAFYMKKAGLDVLMLDKEQFPRDKPCGDGVIPAVFPILKDMGIFEDLLTLGYPSNYTKIYASDDTWFEMERQTTIPGEDSPMYCITRYEFDNLVHQAAIKAGVDAMHNFEVTEIIMERGQAKGVRGIHNGKLVTIESDLVVLASGSHSMVARAMGFYEEDPHFIYYGLRGYFDGIEGLGDRVEFYFPDEYLPSGYIWLFPKSPTMSNVGIYIPEEALLKTGKTTEELLWDWINNTPMGQVRMKNAKLIGKLKGWRLPTGMRQPIFAGGVMAVGDAGNMIEQFGGGGIPQAMLAGQIAAGVAAQAVAAGDFSKEFLKAYDEAVRTNIGPIYDAMEAVRSLGFSTPEQVKTLVKYMNDHKDENPSLMDYLVKECGLSMSEDAATMSHF